MRFIRYCCLCWLAFACTEDGKGDGSNAVLLSPAQSTYTAACQRDTLQFEAEGAWSVVADSPWVTLELAEGKGDGAVPLYIQQNDGEQAREARVTVRLAGGDTLAVRLTQYDSDENSMGTLVDLPRTFGLGWGYDLTEDYADPDGLRGQVFDAALLRQYGGERVLATSTETSVKTETLSEHTAQDLTSSLKAKVGGGLDIGIASAKVEMEYAKQMQRNAKVMAQAFIDKGYKVVSGGTDNHCMLIDLRTKLPELTGKKAENTLVKADITINKNMVPFDSRSAFQTSGIRVGTPAVTTRGLKEEDMKTIVDMIDRILCDPDNEAVIAAVKKEVNGMMNERPMFAW